MTFFKISFLYILLVLVCLFLWSLIYWLPPGYTLAGHDSGLPLNAKQFLLSRLYSWDDRLGFGLDNSANFGSLTIHFFDWISSVLAGTPYAGNYFSLFFWLGLIFVSAFIFAYQLKEAFGKPFVFILPVFLTINFYIFQSVFMLERAKFGVFAATLILLSVFIRMQDKKLSILTSAIIVALTFSIFNGGGWFGVTLYGGVLVAIVSLLLSNFIRGFIEGNFSSFKRSLLFIILSLILYLFINAYSILTYAQNFISTDVPHIIQESSTEGHIDWLRYVSRSTSLINLFRLYGVPDWYSEPNELNPVNESHPYADIYLNNKILSTISFILPLVAFASFLLAKTRKQKQLLSIFGLITLLELVFAAGSNSPFGSFYEFLMDNIPGFFLLRSAFYKFGIFYMLGILVLFAFTLSLLIEKLVDKIPNINGWIRNTALVVLTTFILGSWLGYHFVLFDPIKVFSWKSDQSTRMQVPSYIYEFEKFAEDKKLDDKRVLMLPPVNKDWENDAYSWGYWSLSPLPFTLSSIRTLSNWHGLSSDELTLVDNLYNSVKENDEKTFFELANRADLGYVLLRQDVLTDSKWSASERPESYKVILESFESIAPLASFGQWHLYQIKGAIPMQIYATSSVNVTSDNFVPLVNNFFTEEHTVGLFDRKKYPEIDNITLNKVYAYDCLSCLLERQVHLKSLPDTIILPGSPVYYFKENREQKVLTQSKDSRSKIANYLGFVLTRTSELKKMLDFSVKEERLLSNAIVIRSYLLELGKEVKSSNDYSVDFELLSQVLDFLSPVERAVSDHLKTNASKSYSHRFEEEMLGILWDINQIKEYFSPILHDRERWSNEKVYKLTFPESGNYSLNFSAKAFPKTDNKAILPKKVTFIKGNEEKVIKITENKKGWLGTDLGYQDSGDAKLIVNFNTLPNLFSIEETKLEEEPLGDIGCFNGRIKNFDKQRAYEILISKTERLRNVKVILRDKDRSYSNKHGFLKGEDLFEVPAVASGEFSKYVYFPAPYANNIFVYVCNDDKTPPTIDKIIVREFFSPSVIVIKKNDYLVPTVPKISYTRINPTSYKGNVEPSNSPFILVFNEKINQLWELSIKDNGNWKVIDKHMMIDGHTNGWFIKEGGIREFKIEYIPQRWFYIGGTVSLLSLLSCLVWLLTHVFKKGSNEN